MGPGLVLVALVVSATLAGAWGRAGAAMLAVASLAWLLVNGPMEGRVLVEVSAHHGLTAADLAGLAGLLLAVVIVLRGRIRS